MVVNFRPWPSEMLTLRSKKTKLHLSILFICHQMQDNAIYNEKNEQDFLTLITAG